MTWQGQGQDRYCQTEFCSYLYHSCTIYSCYQHRVVEANTGNLNQVTYNRCCGHDFLIWVYNEEEIVKCIYDMNRVSIYYKTVHTPLTSEICSKSHYDLNDGLALGNR